ncbi:MarR family transcriptional regulator [Hellea sp.]|nr:MarR family transcriptional regulator [Hellea sp.]
MDEAKSLDSIDGAEPASKVKHSDYTDTILQSLSDKISDNYDHIIKTCVMPHIGETHGLKMREIRIITCMELHDVPLSPSHIADLVRYDPATVTRAMSRLVKADMVLRERAQKDTRIVTFTLTDTGRALLSLYDTRVRTVFTTLEGMMEKSLSLDEQAEFLTTVYKVNKRSRIMRDNAALLRKAMDTKSKEDIPLFLAAAS